MEAPSKKLNKISLGVLYAFLSFFCVASHAKNDTPRVILGVSAKNTSVSVSPIVLKPDFKTISQIQKNYEEKGKEVKILIVPGHEPSFGGTGFNNLWERDLNVDLGNEIKKLLEKNTHYKVYITRDKENWDPVFSSYFDGNLSKIPAWINASRKDFQKNKGSVKKVGEKKAGVPHNTAPPGVAERLYAITKWANENSIDIVLHVHFNDYGGRVGKEKLYSGFAIYVPESKYGNSETTKHIAEYVFGRLKKQSKVSNLPIEDAGIVEDEELIAIGASNTSSAPSMLIEYAYIYENQVQNKRKRNFFIKDMAKATYDGVEDFFKSKEVPSPVGTSGLPQS